MELSLTLPPSWSKRRRESFVRLVDGLMAPIPPHQCLEHGDRFVALSRIYKGHKLLFDDWRLAQGFFRQSEAWEHCWLNYRDWAIDLTPFRDKERSFDLPSVIMPIEHFNGAMTQVRQFTINEYLPMLRSNKGVHTFLLEQNNCVSP